MGAFLFNRDGRFGSNPSSTNRQDAYRGIGGRATQEAKAERLVPRQRRVAVKCKDALEYIPLSRSA